MHDCAISDYIGFARKAYSHGNHVDALSQLSEIEPRDRREQAELALSRGALQSFHDFYTTNQPQAESREMLEEAFDYFFKLDSDAHILYASNFLALSYNRTCEFAVAKAFIALSLNLNFPDDFTGRIHAFIIKAMINLHEGKYKMVRSELLRRKKYFNNSTPYLKAMFYSLLACAKAPLGMPAVHDFETARDIFRDLGNTVLWFFAENNVANCFRRAGNKELAFNAVNRALSVARKNKNVRHFACLYDTQAMIALDFKEYDDALEFADKAINSLIDTEHYQYLVEYYCTKIKILFAIERADLAHEVYEQAGRVAKAHCPPFIGKQLHRLMARRIKQSGGVEVVGRAFVETTCGIEIANNKYQHLGLKTGYLAITKNCVVNNDDFIAALDVETGCYHLGFVQFYGQTLGLTVGGGDDTPHLFNRSELKGFAKVIGYCKPNDSTIYPLIFGD